MNYLILVRHGQSTWNLEKRFTGWVDVELTEKGKQEARKSGELIKQLNIKIDHFFCSYQKRAFNTLELILDTIKANPHLITKAWQLNERHYGELTGLNKDEMKKIYGEKKIHIFRRSWDMAPGPLDKNNSYHPLNMEIYKNIPKKKIPNSESLRDTYNRVMPYYIKNIQPLIYEKKNILISGHGNSLRALCKSLFKISDKKISKLEIPTGNPLLIKFSEKLNIVSCNYLDKERSRDLLIKF